MATVVGRTIVTEKIDLAFSVECRLCGTRTSFDLDRIDPEKVSRCSVCGHPFTMSHELALSLRSKVDSFMQTIPEEKDQE
ncbi:MAG: hypothetical protein P8Z70_01290 [Desulfuromonadales bacterium]|jgi:ribosomal protein L37E